MTNLAHLKGQRHKELPTRLLMGAAGPLLPYSPSLQCLCSLLLFLPTSSLSRSPRSFRSVDPPPSPSAILQPSLSPLLAKLPYPPPPPPLSLPLSLYLFCCLPPSPSLTLHESLPLCPSPPSPPPPRSPSSLPHLPESQPAAAPGHVTRRGRTRSTVCHFDCFVFSSFESR